MYIQLKPLCGIQFKYINVLGLYKAFSIKIDTIMWNTWFNTIEEHLWTLGIQPSRSQLYIHTSRTWPTLLL